MSETVKQPDTLSLRLAKIMVGGAIFAAICYAVDLGVARAAHWYLVPAIALGLVCVVIGEILSWHNAAMAFHERRAGSMFTWALLGCICSGGTLYTNFSTSALNQDENSAIQQTAFNTYDDSAKTERELTRKLEDLDARLKLAPVETADAYDAKIETFKAHKWWNATDECRSPKGPKTRAWCSDYASAVANKSNATNSLTLTEERKVAAAQLKQVREERKTSKAVVSEDSPAIVFLANYTGNKAEARQLDSMTFPGLVQAILILGGILLANEEARRMVKKPWINWRRVGFFFHWVTAALSFRPLPSWSDYQVNNNYTTIIDPHGAEALRRQQQHETNLGRNGVKALEILGFPNGVIA